VSEAVLLIGIIRFSCYTYYNQETAFNMIGGLRMEGGGIVAEVALVEGCKLV
jgi:hypothetical protein